MISLHTPDGDAELVALCAEIATLEVQINAIVNVCQTIEEEEADVVADPLRDSQKEMIERICAMRATTLAEVAARARALIAWAPDYSGKVGSDYLDEKMLGALLRDLTAVTS